MKTQRLYYKNCSTHGYRPGYDKFCPACGEKLKRKLYPTCPQCGQAYSPTNPKYCRLCGNTLPITTTPKTEIWDELRGFTSGEKR